MFIKVPKGTPVIPMDIVTEKQMISEDSINVFGGGDIGYEESEMLMSMCDIEVNNHYQAPNGKTMANATIVRQKNSIEIMEKRLEEMRDMIVQYGGQEKLEELRAQVQAIKSQFSEQEIGKATINVATENKDKAQIQVQRDEQLLPKEQDSQQSID